MARTRKLLRRIDLRMYTRFKGGKLMVSIIPVGDAFITQGASLELMIYHRQEAKILMRKRIANLANVIGREITLDMKRLPSGCGEFHGVLTDRHGRSTPVGVMQDKLPPDVPGWFGSRAGIKRGVPKPWTPLTVKRPSRNRLVVECWGREYRFSATTLVQAIFTAKQNVLAQPIRFFGKVNGRAFRPTRGKLRCLASDQDRVEIEQRITDGNLVIDVQTQIDFDGMIRFDWAVSCNQAVRVDSLGLESPVRVEHANYLYHFPGDQIWGNSSNAGARPDEHLKMGFKPYIWLGDDDRGLGWIAESDRNRYISSDGLASEIIPRGKYVTMRQHFIARPVRLLPESQRPKTASNGPAELEAGAEISEGIGAKRISLYSPITHSIALQATPVKPVGDNAWDNRTICLVESHRGFKPRMSIQPSVLDELVEAGVRTVILFEHWSDHEAHSIPVDRDKVRRIVDDCHDRDLKILFYFGFLISDTAPEWRDFGRNCIRTPMHGYPLFHYTPQSDQSAWIVCLNSAWQDFVADSIARTMDDFKIDGVYLDSTEYIWGCNNTLHGCGSTHRDGTVTLSYPIFSVRSAMQRLYNAVKTRRPDAQINVHNSTCMVMPTLAFATSAWDGEQFQNVKGRATASSLLPMDTFRCEFMGRQWGVPTEFLSYGKGFSTKESWAIPFLHDVPVRPNSPDGLEPAATIWRVMDAFDHKHANWHPYWQNAEMVRSKTPGVYTSLYHHPTNGVLAVIANISGRTAPVEVTFNWRKLHLRENHVIITDALTGRRTEVAGSLRPFDWKLLWLKPDQT